ENREDETESTDVLALIKGEWQVIPSLKITSRFNYKYGEYVQDTYYPNEYTEAGDFNNGAAGIYNWKARNMVSETFANFDRTFGGLHKIGATLGYSYQLDLWRSSDLGAYDFVNETLGNENMGAGNPELNQVS